MDLVNAITSRRSIRWYRQEPVPVDLVNDLLRYATLAPSAHNRQPWRFAVLTSSRSKTRMAETMGSRLRRDREKDGTPPEVIEADVQRSIKRIVEAPVVILSSTTMREMDQYWDARRAEAERITAVQSTAMAVQNLLLAAHDAGLAACIICAPLFCPDDVITSLNLPKDWLPQSLITLGWPAAVKTEYSRRPLNEVVIHLDA